MKKSKAETAETRKRIVDVAVRAFKANGIHATGVAEIMAAAGLTHGGFYRHFASKEQLVAEACAAGMETLVCAAATAAEGGPEAFLKHLERIFSAGHRDDTLGGCPLVAMGSELVRADEPTRHAVSQGFEALIDIVAKWMPDDDAQAARANAAYTLSSMIGAVTMSRIVDNRELSDQILDMAKSRLVDWPVKDQVEAKKRPAKTSATSRKRIATVSAE
jgi:TetR/AcrR family transcriptional repressor of nem operon